MLGYVYIRDEETHTNRCIFILILIHCYGELKLHAHFKRCKYYQLFLVYMLLSYES